MRRTRRRARHQAAAQLAESKIRFTPAGGQRADE